MRFAVLLLVLPLAASQPPALTGTVLDSSTGEVLSGVLFDTDCAGSVARTTSNPDGSFVLTLPPATACSVTARLIGYRPLRTTIRLTDPPLKLALTPDQLTRRDSVNVAPGPFELSQQSSPSERTLGASEVKNLAGLLGDDPLRAIQALPGVASNNDFVSTFTLRGSGFDRVGILYDGILLHSPYHAVQTQVPQGSLTMFNPMSSRR